MTPRVAVIFDRFGPYHWARLSALCEHFNVLALETRANTGEYAWDRIEGPSPFERRTLFGPLESDGRSIPEREVTRRVEAALDTAGPSAVFIPGWATPAALSALRWCLRNQRHSIVMSESTARDDRRRWLKEMAKKRLVSLFSAGLVGGAAHADYLAALGMPRTAIFKGYDVVDNEYFAREASAARQKEAATREALNLPPAYFLASCRFLPKKNLVGLLQAYASYRTRAGTEYFKLVLLGDGPLRARVLQEQEQLALGEDLILPGFVQYKQLPAYYALAIAFVHASTIEPWGLVVNEAMACGLPVLISNRCGCAGDLVRDGHNGYSFDPDATEELTDKLLAIAKLSREQRLAMGEASSALIASYSPATFAKGAWHAWTAASTGSARRLTFFDAFLLRVLSARL